MSTSSEGLMESELLALPAAETDKLTHYLFRYPAKFHPPVIRALLAQYARPGDRILDPFCGSGTALIEAAVAGFESVGTDIDPVAVAVSLAKTRRYDMRRLQATVDKLRKQLALLRRDPLEYEARMFLDLDNTEFPEELDDEWVPAIPRLHHWFRKYVLVDLARIRRVLSEQGMHEIDRDLLLVVFASIIRNASNADPVPVSGLEVTSHILERDRRGRLIDPFTLFDSALRRAVLGVSSYSNTVLAKHVPNVRQLEAAHIAHRFRKPFQLVITSPPYHNAVDYYRRHQLEMYWLGLTKNHAERLDLLPRYIGRHRVPAGHPVLATPWHPSPLAGRWEQQMRESSASRADDFKHYLLSMGEVFRALAHSIVPGGHALFVVGQSVWGGEEIPTKELFTELASPDFQLARILTYPVKNRYMSYARKNGADIKTEYVLVLTKM